MKTILLFLCIAFAIGCKKEEQTVLKDYILFDTITAYPNDSISLSFHFDSKKIDYKNVVWTNPKEFNGFETFKTSVKSDFNFNFLINKNSSDTISYVLKIDTIKNNPRYDFRNIYVGNYHFKIDLFHAVDNYTRWVDTITYYEGTVEKLSDINTHKLLITFGHDHIGWDLNGIEVKESLPLTLNVNGILSYPEYNANYGHNYLYPASINKDSVSLSICYGGLGGSSSWNVVGFKKK